MQSSLYPMSPTYGEYLRLEELLGLQTGLEDDEDDPEFYKGDREVLDFYDQPEIGPLEEEDGD